MATKKRPSGTAVTRREFEAVVRAVEDCSRALQLQFTRIAQIQAELDRIRSAWQRSTHPERGTGAVAPPLDFRSLRGARKRSNEHSPLT